MRRLPAFLVSVRARVRTARQYHRWAQFYADFIEAENSMGFHADQEAVRILGKSINYARLGQMALAGQPVPPPSAGATTAASPQNVTPRPDPGGD